MKLSFLQVKIGQKLNKKSREQERVLFVGLKAQLALSKANKANLRLPNPSNLKFVSSLKILS